LLTIQTHISTQAHQTSLAIRNILNALPAVPLIPSAAGFACFREKKMNGERSFLGLGYNLSISTQDNDTHPNRIAHDRPSSEQAADHAESLMKQYLLQCLEYHEEQENVRNQQTQGDRPTSQSSFVPASQAPVAFDPIRDNSSKYTNTEEAGLSVADQNTANAEVQIEAAKLRAQEILVRFSQQQHSLLQVPAEVSVLESDNILLPSLFAEQRVRGLQREEERKNIALLKNFEYVARKQSEQLQRLAAQVEQARQAEAHAHSLYQQQLKERHKRQLHQADLQSQAGIGTLKRARAEKSKEKAGHVPQTAARTVAVYLTGLPVDGSVRPEYIAGLFSSYEKVVKTHFYRDKKSGELKGDGLVVFELSASALLDSGENLVQSICVQVRVQALYMIIN
jgi:hypothetical protein